VQLFTYDLMTPPLVWLNPMPFVPWSRCNESGWYKMAKDSERAGQAAE
jgi:hypothetical protein